jgi:hypothetical protein
MEEWGERERARRDHALMRVDLFTIFPKLEADISRDGGGS